MSFIVALYWPWLRKTWWVLYSICFRIKKEIKAIMAINFKKVSLCKGYKSLCFKYFIMYLPVLILQLCIRLSRSWIFAFNRCDSRVKWVNLYVIADLCQILQQWIKEVLIELCILLKRNNKLLRVKESLQQGEHN